MPGMNDFFDGDHQLPSPSGPNGMHQSPIGCDTGCNTAKHPSRQNNVSSLPKKKQKQRTKDRPNSLTCKCTDCGEYVRYKHCCCIKWSALKPNWTPQALFVEFFGTAVLVFSISMALLFVCSQFQSHVEYYSLVEESLSHMLAKFASTLLTGLTAGAILFCLVSSFEGISGAHFNPIVTLAMVCTGKLHAVVGFLYIIVQFIGCLVAGAVIMMFYHSQGSLCVLGTPQISPDFSPGISFFAEMLGSFILVSLILCVEHSPWSNSSCVPLVCGFALCLLHFIFMPISGASFNFWRFLGPAIFANHFDYWWIYLFGPLVGGLFSVLLYYLLHFSEILEFLDTFKNC